MLFLLWQQRLGITLYTKSQIKLHKPVLQAYVFPIINIMLNRIIKKSTTHCSYGLSIPLFARANNDSAYRLSTASSSNLKNKPRFSRTLIQFLTNRKEKFSCTLLKFQIFFYRSCITGTRCDFGLVRILHFKNQFTVKSFSNFQYTGIINDMCTI